MKFFLDSKENVCGRSNQSSFIFRELTLADSEPTCEFVLVDIESSDLPEPSSKGLQLGSMSFRKHKFSVDKYSCI